MADEPSGLRVAFRSTDDGMEQVEPAASGPAAASGGTSHAYYGAVVVRGGVTDADLLRTASAAVSSFQELPESDRPATGQPVLLEAAVVRGQTRTPWTAVRDDVEKADGQWVETSRHPGELPSFRASLTQDSPPQ